MAHLKPFRLAVLISLVSLIVLMLFVPRAGTAPRAGKSPAPDVSYPFKESSLSGVVKSQKGESLEGVLVRAKKDGAHVAMTVSTEENGKYRFPRMESGKYLVETARADGFEPVKQSVEVKDAQEAHADFTIGPAKEMDQQISAADWVLNLPKGPNVELCLNCHFNTVRKFRFDQENWAKIVRVMRGSHGNLLYQNWAMPQHAQRQNAPPDIESPNWEKQNQVIAEYLAKVRGPEPLDLSNAKILPRQKGRATHVLYTEYDVPYDSAEPHDVGVSADGVVFWGDWRWGRLGMLDPKTGAMKYWDIKQMDGKAPMHPGAFQVVFDKDDNPWTENVWQGGLVKLDRKTETLTSWMFPDTGYRRIIMASSDLQRGRIWFETDDYYGHWDMAYYQPAVDKLAVHHIPYRPGHDQSFIYGHVLDSKGNIYALMSGDSDIARIDVETEKLVRYPTPTPDAFPRRGDYDSEDRIWFSEYNAGQVGMFDPKTEKITEYKLPTPMSKAYSSNVDRKTGLVWSAEFLADRFDAMNPKTGEMTDYLLPTRDSQVRIIAPKSTGDHTVLWYGVLSKYEGGKIAKLEAW